MTALKAVSGCAGNDCVRNQSVTGELNIQ